MPQRIRASRGVLAYSVRYAGQSLICSALQRKQHSPPFGSAIIATVLDHKDIKHQAYSTQVDSRKTPLGTMCRAKCLTCCVLPMTHQLSRRQTVCKANTPALSPPDPPQPRASFNKKLKGMILSQPIDFEGDLTDNGGLEDFPFAFLCLLSRDSTQATRAKEQEDKDDSDELTKQAVPSTHSPQVLGRRRRGEETSDDAHLCAS